MVKNVKVFSFFFFVASGDTKKEFNVNIEAQDYIEAAKKYYRNPHAIYAHKVTNAGTGNVVYIDMSV